MEGGKTRVCTQKKNKQMLFWNSLSCRGDFTVSRLFCKRSHGCVLLTDSRKHLRGKGKKVKGKSHAVLALVAFHWMRLYIRLTMGAYSKRLTACPS